MTTTQESYPPLVGALAALPEHVRSVVVALDAAIDSAMEKEKAK